MKNHAVFGLLLALLPTGVAAEARSFDDIARECIKEIERVTHKYEEIEIIRPYAKRLEEMASEAHAAGGLMDLEPALSSSAADCAAYVIPWGEGNDFYFDTSAGRYLMVNTSERPGDGEVIDQVLADIFGPDGEERRANSEQMKKNAEMDLQVQAAKDRIAASRAEAQRLARIEFIENKTFKACSHIFRSDWVVAFSNKLCVETFREKGLPE